MKSFFKEYGFAILSSVVVVALVAVCMVLKEPIQARLGEITNTWGNNVVNSLKFTNGKSLEEDNPEPEGIPSFPNIEYQDIRNVEGIIFDSIQSIYILNSDMNLEGNYYISEGYELDGCGHKLSGNFLIKNGAIIKNTDFDEGNTSIEGGTFENCNFSGQIIVKTTSDTSFECCSFFGDDAVFYSKPGVRNTFINCHFCGNNQTIYNGYFENCSFEGSGTVYDGEWAGGYAAITGIYFVPETAPESVRMAVLGY